jgi:hypothetical protein
MSNKYYTPDISEFHVGFECETKINTVAQELSSDHYPMPEE